MKKEGLTTVEKAILNVEGFGKVYKIMQLQIVLHGQSNSTLANYSRRVALICLHFGRLPQDIREEEINEYLAELAIDTKSPARSSFKHAVYGLRYYFRHIGLENRAIKLPSIKEEFKLPVILNRSELRELFRSPTLLKHRIALSLIYSAGLRSQEAVNLKISDIDFERQTIHIRQSKYKKDRIVPLSRLMARGLRTYFSVVNPYQWVFNGKEPHGQYSVKGLSWVLRETLKKTTIKKIVTMHSLRHSYATHLLEDGVNIVFIKELLGHANITTTMIYLHVANVPSSNVHSPFDTLYPEI